MINIYIEDNFIEIEGHAGYAESGKDIVCAGISALFFTLVESLDGIAIPVYSYREGHAKCQFAPLSKDADVVFRTVVNGMKLIADNYPENVNVVRG